MSAFLGGTADNFGGMLYATDDRIAQSNFQWSHKPPRQTQAPWDDGQLWPASRSMGGGFTGSLSRDAQSDSGRYEPYGGWALDDTGGQQQKKIIGLTLDSTGAVLGNCVVQGFVTATDVFEGQVTSDPTGYYELPCQYAGNHFVVAYKAGSPDVSGASVNTLTPV